MSKLTIRENFRVIVEPEMWGKYDEKKAMSECNSIVEDIKRHVDGVKCVGIEYDTTEVCSYCGYGWEVDETGLPQCCVKAQDEFNSLDITPSDKTNQL